MSKDMKPEWSDSERPDIFSTTVRKGVETEAEAVVFQKSGRFKKRVPLDQLLKS